MPLRQLNTVVHSAPDADVGCGAGIAVTTRHRSQASPFRWGSALGLTSCGPTKMALPHPAEMSDMDQVEVLMPATALHQLTAPMD